MKSFREPVTSERTREFCEVARNVAAQNGVFKTSDVERLASHNQFIACAIEKGYVKRLKRGFFKWTGPDEITVLVGESLFRAYKAYQKVHAPKHPKTNGAANHEEIVVPLKAQVSELTDRVNDLQAKVNRLLVEIGE